MTCFSSLQFMFLKMKINTSPWNEKLAPHNSHFTITKAFFRFGNHFDDRPKMLTYHQISRNIFFLTNCPMKITVSQEVSQADMRTSDVNRVKWLRQQLRTVMLWEFFFLYFHCSKWYQKHRVFNWLVTENKSGIVPLLVRYFFRATIDFKDMCFLERTNLFDF